MLNQSAHNGVHMHQDPSLLFEGHHRGLREHISQLHRSVSQDHPDIPAIHAALGAIKSFAESHFADEEKLMGDVAYPGRSEHEREHSDFLTYIRRLNDAMATATPYSLPPGTLALAQSLAEWWETHAQHYDRGLVDFLCRGGI